MRKRIIPAMMVMMLILLNVQGTLVFASNGENYSITASNHAPKVGEEFNVTVHGKKLEDLYGYEVNVHYSPMKLQFVRATNLIGEGFSISPIVQDGRITFAFTKIGASTKGLNGSSDMVQFTFKSIEKGATDVQLLSMKTVNSLKEAQGYTLSAAVNVRSLLNVSFIDVVEKDWYYSAIMRAAGIGIVSGYQDGTFKPRSNVTRAEFVSMLSRAFELPETRETSALSFKDIDTISAWAKQHVANAVELGWISGYQDGTFRPNQSINRAEMAVIAARALGLDIEKVGELAFSDAEQIAGWARPYISRATEIGLIHGRGNNSFVPEANTTRAEAVSVILRVVDAKAKQ